MQKTETKLEIVETEEVVEGHNLPAIIEQPASISPYHGIGMVPISKEQQKALEAPIDPDQLDILPTGEVYMSQVWYRRKLNSVFGAGRWGLMPLGAYSQQDQTLMREYALIVNGCFVSDAIGEADYHPNNDRMSYATAATSLKSNALSRLCKDLGIASECWDKRFSEAWKDQHAVSVWRRDAKKKAPQWRRTNAKPFYDETGYADPPKNSNTAPPRASSPVNGSSAASTAPKAATGQQADPKSIGVIAGEVYSMPVHDVKFQDGMTGTKAWTRFDIAFGNGGGIVAATFDQEQADLAYEIKTKGGLAEFVLIAPKKGRGWNLDKIRWAEGGNPAEYASSSEPDDLPY